MVDKINVPGLGDMIGGVAISKDDTGINVDINKATAKTTTAGSDYILVYDAVNGVRKITRDEFQAGTNSLIIRGAITLADGSNQGSTSDGVMVRATDPGFGNGTAYVVSGYVSQNSIAGTSDTDYEPYNGGDIIAWYTDRWTRIASSSAPVGSVFGRTGEVVQEAGDITPTLINTDTGTVQSDISDIQTTLTQIGEPWVTDAGNSVHFEEVQRSNKDKYAASGFINYGRHYQSGDANVPINEGLWSDIGLANQLPLGSPI